MGVLFTQKLIADDGVPGDGLGASAAVSADGTTAVLSTYRGATGAAYVFTRSGATWSQRAKLMGSDVGERRGVWEGMAVGATTAVVPANFGDGAQLHPGAGVSSLPSVGTPGRSRRS